MDRKLSTANFGNIRLTLLVALLLVTVGASFGFQWFQKQERKTSGEDEIQLLRDYYKQNDDLFENSGWSLDQISFLDGVPRVIFVFPDQKAGLRRMAPIYTSLKGFCPVTDYGDFWAKTGVASVTLFLRRENKQGAIMMARCFSDFDSKAARNVASDFRSSVALELLPPSDYALTEEESKKRLASGTPSFNDALDAIKRKDNGKLQEILYQRPELTKFHDHFGATLLSHADSASAVVVLIAFGANPNVIDERDYTLVEHMVCGLRGKKILNKLFNMGGSAEGARFGCVYDVEMAELLLENGAIIKNDSLWEVVDNLQEDVADYLYSKGARFSNQLNQESILHYCVDGVYSNGEQIRPKKFKILELALRFTQNVNEVNRQGQTPLDIALAAPEHSHKSKVIDLLMAHGAKPSSQLN